MSTGSGNQDRESMELDVKSSVDMDILGDNITDIAHFTVEKYEFRHGETLSDDVREEAVKQIKEVLWQRAEKLLERRKQILANMFSMAASTLEDLVKSED